MKHLIIVIVKPLLIDCNKIFPFSAPYSTRENNGVNSNQSHTIGCKQTHYSTIVLYPPPPLLCLVHLVIAPFSKPVKRASFFIQTQLIITKVTFDDNNNRLCKSFLHIDDIDESKPIFLK